jgi:hypothetical protein
MRDQATADAIESMELYSNLHRRESTLGYLRPIAFEESEAFAEVCVHGIGRRSFCSLAYGVSDVLRRNCAVAGAAKRLTALERVGRSRSWAVRAPTRRKLFWYAPNCGQRAKSEQQNNDA